MLHRPATEVGLYYLVVLAGVPIGSFSSSRLVRRVPSILLLRATSAIALAGAALFFVVAAIGSLTVVTVLGPMILFSVGVGCGIASRHHPGRPRARFHGASLRAPAGSAQYPSNRRSGLRVLPLIDMPDTASASSP